jgi:hypothetical protein
VVALNGAAEKPQHKASVGTVPDFSHHPSVQSLADQIPPGLLSAYPGPEFFL